MPVIRDDQGNYHYMVSVSHELTSIVDELYPNVAAIVEDLMGDTTDLVRIIPRSAVGQNIAAGLDMQVGQWVIGIASEKLAEEEFDWPSFFTNYLAETNPGTNVLYSSFDTATQTLSPAVPVQGSDEFDEGVASITVRNASVEGQGLAYQTSRIAQLYPERPDLVIVAVGHSYDEAAASAYLSSVDSFVTALHSTYPNVPLLFTSQNPSFSFGSEEDDPEFRTPLAVLRHRERFAALRGYAQTNGHAYLPVFEILTDPQFSAGSGVVLSDGWRPTSESTDEFESATSMWGRLVSGYFASMAYRRRDYSIVT